MAQLYTPSSLVAASLTRSYMADHTRASSSLRGASMLPDSPYSTNHNDIPQYGNTSTAHEQLLAVVSAAMEPPVHALTLQERLDDPTTGPLKEDDFKNAVRFWHKKSYTGPTNASNVEESGNKHACHYLEDETGQVIDIWRVNVIRERARAFWIQLYYAGKAPLQWSYAPLDTMQDFHQCMNHFKEFRLCADNWKAAQLGYMYYSGWLTKFKRSHPGIKQDLWDEPIGVESSRSSLKREAETPPAIDLEEDDTPAPVPKKHKTAGGKSSSGKGKAVLKIKNPFAAPALATADTTSTTTTLSATPSEPAVPPAPSFAAPAPSSAAPAPSSAAPAPSSAAPAPSSAAPAPSSALPAPSSAPPTTSSTPPTTSSTPPAQPSVSPVDATCANTDTLAAIPNTAPSGETLHGDCEAHATGGNKRPPGDTELTTATPGRSLEDPPSTLAAVPAADAAAPAVQTRSVVVTGKKGGARVREGAGSLYTPTSSLTVRNLCGMEWKKANPKGTTGAFGAYYDSLTQAEQDRFVQLSKTKKAEAKASAVKDIAVLPASATVSLPTQAAGASSESSSGT
ncbi:hypothetical protein B0H21DRAFT_890537 [Amylocystis lapponica]|nr:hypothetical protein B0H21DRAFT_895117 [Amylocystis lapponica]KAH9932850.1 hypothetical protein B0H21DRAFT_894478 [Amylocystis lapponica]KAH9948369.1 hypothetical protein B0H21DRAFT_890537 [Amylocystis lapponica]